MMFCTGGIEGTFKTLLYVKIKNQFSLGVKCQHSVEVLANPFEIILRAKTLRA